MLLIDIQIGFVYSRNRLINDQFYLLHNDCTIINQISFGTYLYINNSFDIKFQLLRVYWKDGEKSITDENILIINLILYFKPPLDQNYNGIIDIVKALFTYSCSGY